MPKYKMATGIITPSYPEIEIFDGTTLSDWYEPYSGYEIMNLSTTPSNATLRRITPNIFHLYMAVLGNFTDHNTVTIGKFKSSFFGNHPVSGYIPAVVGGTSNAQYASTARISGTAGTLSICPGGTVSYCYIHGFFLLRSNQTLTY